MSPKCMEIQWNELKIVYKSAKNAQKSSKLDHLSDTLSTMQNPP